MGTITQKDKLLYRIKKTLPLIIEKNQKFYDSISLMMIKNIQPEHTSLD